MATNTQHMPLNLTPAEQVERQIVEALISLEGAESLLWQLDAGSTFDIGTALTGAREALRRALQDIPQPEIEMAA